MAGLVRQGGQQVVTVTAVSATLRNLAIDLLHLARVKEMTGAKGFFSMAARVSSSALSHGRRRS